MPMESLLTLVETLRKLIDVHADALRHNEMQTRYALIDPLLRELGWDTADPHLVIPEYTSGVGRADYALLDNGKPVMMVEAKKLDEPLRGAVSQGIQYCLEGGTKYFAVTDGRRWEIYETHKQVPLIDKMVVAFDLKGRSAAEVCLQALALWRPSVADGSVRPGQTPVACLTAAQTIPNDPRPIDPPPMPPPPPIPPKPGLQPLTTLKPVPSKNNPPPSEILFPDNSRADIKHWFDIATSVVRWLMDQGLLTAAHCPISHGNSHLLATTPTHPNGRAMKHRKIGELYLNRDFTSLHQVRNSRIIIEHVGQDPSQFNVRFP